MLQCFMTSAEVPISVYAVVIHHSACRGEKQSNKSPAKGK